jgi:hypothetical protein
MNSELAIRPGFNDHKVIESLLAPGGSRIFSSRRPLLGQLVVDATVASYRLGLANAAAGAGVPYVIDPLTPLLQGELAPNDPWARLPFGQTQAMKPEDFRSADARQDLIASVVNFQTSMGATAIVAPYGYASAPSDPWFQLSMQFITETADYMARSKVRRPLIPVLCAQLQTFGVSNSWADGAGLFGRVASTVDPLYLALCLSPAGTPDESYGKVQRLFALALRLREQRMRVIAWRQGVYGPGLVAAGLDGYETGIGVRERVDVAGSISRRKPRPQSSPKKPRVPHAVLVLPLGRSLALSLARKLLDDPHTRPNLVCDDEQCCPDGMHSMLENHREHTVRSRARYLADLDDMPMAEWRLFHVGKDARNAVTLIGQINRFLAPDQNGPHKPLAAKSMASLAQVADHLLEERIRRSALSAAAGAGPQG